MIGRICCVLVLLSLLLVVPVQAAEVRMALPGLIGSYICGPDGMVVYNFDLGQNFSNIQDVKIHLVGSITPGTMIYPTDPDSGEGPNIRLVPAHFVANTVYDYSYYHRALSLDTVFNFDVTAVFDPMPGAPDPFTPTPPRDPNWFQDLFDGKGTISLSFEASDIYEIAPSGNLTDAELIIDGTPAAVPEPGSIAAMLCGLGGLGGLALCKRK